LSGVTAVVAVILALLSLNLIWSGVSETAATTGIVQGTKFGMLISLVNQMGSLHVWLGVFAIWLLTHPALRNNRGNAQP
jgi:hypothetical protein